MKSLLLLPAILVAVSMPMGEPVVVTQPLGEHDWVVDAGHSACVFRVKHANASWFLGTFDKVEGKVTLDAAAPEKGSVELTIATESIDSNDKQRDGHLMSPDFFNGKENPEITFKSTKIKADGKNLNVTGDLSLAGKTKSITIPVEFVGEGEFRGARRGYITTFAIKRSDFGMTYGVKKNVLGDDVHMTVSLELVQPK
ncbi:MAG: polyisoprenoid-binding protein YceI [Planctomycetota bacterium]|jgi:polyisoprenoid-binding protein YceI